MATLGFADLKDTALPTLWDAGELERIKLADGATLASVTNDVQLALLALNASLLEMPHYGSLIAVQDDAALEYNIGVSNGFEEATEYGVPDPKRGKTSGHMLPIKKYDRSLGWTQMYLREARRTKLDADIRSLVVDARNLWQRNILTRFFKMEGEKVGTTANASVPFADGGATDSTYVPPQSPDGETFSASHDHFLRQDAINLTNVTAAIEHLQEHGHAGPFDIIAARADAASWATLVKNPEWAGIVYRAATDRAAIADITEYFGYIETDYGIARVWLTPRVPSGFYGAFKDYGPGDPRNPLRIRINPNWGFGFNLVPGMYVNAPVQMLLAYTEFGVGVGEDRTNGVCVKIAASGDYTTPTIA